MNAKAAEHIEKLVLLPHPEGGYCGETFRSHYIYRGKQPQMSAIYYLLDGKDFSSFHRLQSDEIWLLNDGDGLVIHELLPSGCYKYHTLSRDNFQVFIPRGSWMAAKPIDVNSYALVSCVCSPGFKYEEFELAKAEELLPQYPDQENIILELCR